MLFVVETAAVVAVVVVAVVVVLELVADVVVVAAEPELVEPVQLAVAAVKELGVDLEERVAVVVAELIMLAAFVEQVE